MPSGKRGVPEKHDMPVEKNVVDEQLARLGTYGRWFTRKERNHLHEILAPGETIHALTSGVTDGNTWLVTVTDRRVVFLDVGMFYGLKQMELPISKITGVTHKTGLLFGEITVEAADSHKHIEKILNDDVVRVAQAISEVVSLATHPPAHPFASQPVAQPFAQRVANGETLAKLEMLANLRQQGLLTAEEFEQQKAKLLS